MRRSAKQSPTSARTGEVAGTARVDARTQTLAQRLRPGEVAIIDHVDLDRVSAQALLARRPVAVLNAARSISGRYPNLGPEILVRAGVPLLDELGPEVMSVAEGRQVRVDGATVLIGDELVAEGVLQSEETVAAALHEAAGGLAVQLESFAANTMDYLRQERDLLLEGVGVPDVATELAGRHVLVVARGYHEQADLAVLRPYIREYRPVLIGAEGGADALIEAGWKPQLVVGDLETVSDAALTCGAEIAVHAGRDGRVPGRSRAEQLGVPFVEFAGHGSSEDLAMLLAESAGAALIVAVGTHATLVEYLDKGRHDMSSTFLTRLRVGGLLVDAQAVQRLYRPRISRAQLAMLVLAGLLALCAALATTEAGRSVLALVPGWWDDLTHWIGHLFGGSS